MTERQISAADLQAVFRFFAAPTLDYFRQAKTVPPACALVWLAADAPAVRSINQFPTHEIATLLQTEAGRAKLAYAITAMFDPEKTSEMLLPGERQHLVVQVVLANTEVAGVQQEVVLMLAHARGVTHATAVVVDPVSGACEMPEAFDITSTPVESEAVADGATCSAEK